MRSGRIKTNQLGVRESDLGFHYEHTDQRYKEMDEGRELAYPMLRGPTGIAWCPFQFYSESAKFLCEPHREEAFKAAFDQKRWNLAHRLGIQMPHIRRRQPDKWKLILKRVGRNPIAGDDDAGYHAACRQYLLYLGDLHVQIVRAVENGAMLCEVEDLRMVDPAELALILDSRKIDRTNERNPYRELFADIGFSIGHFQTKWLLQDDSQINAYHKLLMIRGRQ